MSSVPTPAPAPAPTAAPSRRRVIAAEAAAAPAAKKVVYTEEQKKAFNAARQRFTRGGSANPTAEAHAFIASEYKLGSTTKAVATKAAPAARASKSVTAVVPTKSGASRGRKAAAVAPVVAKPGRGRVKEIRPVRVAPVVVAGAVAPENALVVVSVFGSKQSYYPSTLKEWNQLGSSLFE